MRDLTSGHMPLYQLSNIDLLHTLEQRIGSLTEVYILLLFDLKIKNLKTSRQKISFSFYITESENNMLH